MRKHRTKVVAIALVVLALVAWVQLAQASWCDCYAGMCSGPSGGCYPVGGVICYNPGGGPHGALLMCYRDCSSCCAGWVYMNEC